MKRLVPPALLALLSSLTGAHAVAADTATFRNFTYTGNDAAFAAPLPAGAFRNPVLAGFYPDPSICRVGDDFYLINSTFAYYPGIPISHSRDLRTWRQIGHVIDRPGQLKYDGLGVSRGIFAPALSHHDGTFYVVCTMVDAGGNFVVTARDPAGPWSDPTWLPFEGIDPSLFFDADGRAYIVNNGAPEGTPRYDGHRAIWIQEYDPAARKMTGPRRVLVDGGADPATKPIWIEGPHLYRRDGWYYLCAAEGGTAEGHSQVIFRSKSLEGPFQQWSGNPILTQRDLDGSAPLAVTSTGHADLTIGPDGNWWAVFLGCRPFAGRYYTTGRETFMLPVTWTADGWPVILRKGERVPFVVAGAQLPAGANAANADTPVPLTGNFTWRDDFRASKLSPLWIMLRAPHETWWRLAPDRGLELTARAERLSGNGNPSYLARRVQHARFTATATVEIPAAAGVVAGLAAFQGEKHHVLLGLRRTADGAEVFVEQVKGDATIVPARAALPASTSVELRITARDEVLKFEYATAPGRWQSLAQTDATMLTTQVAGGFVGATVGLHARTGR